MNDINEHEFPAGGGWKFRQAQTNWTNPMAMVGFKASVDAIVKHRQQNKAIAAKYNLSTDHDDVAIELKKFTRARLGIAEPQPSFFQPGHSSGQKGVAAVAANIKRAAKGTAVVLDWLSSGGAPVTKELAEKRGAVCVQCPKNVDGSWYTVAPAELIRQTLSERADLMLRTSHDAELKSCDVCKCLMRLKVWCPLSHILDGTSPEIMAEFPEHCWIKRRDG